MRKTRSRRGADTRAWWLPSIALAVVVAGMGLAGGCGPTTAPPADANAPTQSDTVPAGDHAPAASNATAEDNGLRLAAAGLDPKARASAQFLSATGTRRAGTQKQLDGATQKYLVLLTEFASTDARQNAVIPHAHVFHAYDRFADMFLPVDNEKLNAALAALNEAGMRWYEVDGVIEIPVPPEYEISKESPKAEPEPTVRGGTMGLSGKGVYVAIIDSGVDFRHPDFTTLDANGNPVSRIVALWDTTSDAYKRNIGAAAPVTYPNGDAIGTVFDRDTLTRALNDPTIDIARTDNDGHGTACASIAAGSGTARGGNAKYQGVAPEADIIAVRIGDAGLENGFVFGAALAWLDALADSSPLVVSYSVGSHYGGHDGYNLSDRQLSTRFNPDRQGRAIFCAAGNEGHRPMHVVLPLGSYDNPTTLKMTSEEGGFCFVWFNNPDISIDDLRFRSTGEVEVELDTAYVHGISGYTAADFYVPAGTSELQLWTVGSTPTDVSVYFENGKFDEQLAVYEQLVNSPGIAEGAIAVGSYDFNEIIVDENGDKWLVPIRIKDGKWDFTEIGSLSFYSSPGYCRVGNAVKPEFAAPGQLHVAAKILEPGTQNAASLSDAVLYDQEFNGTSAATPYAAGVAALLFQERPTLTWGALRALLTDPELLSQPSDQQDVSLPRPNTRWGYGKLDADAVHAMINKLRSGA